MNNRNIVLKNLIWRFLERCGAQLVTFVVSMVLARLLGPNIYGTIALVTVFTTILQVFVDSGLGNALIQKKNTDDLDFSSVFYFNVTVCIILYIILFLCAPLIASFYSIPELTPIVRVIGLTIIISGVKNVQQAYVSKNMLFKRFFFATLGGTLGAAVIGIAMAYAGFGVWALVSQMLFNVAMDTIILWITVKWRPKRMFSWERLSSLIGTVYNEIRQLIIGKMYSANDLAFYNKGKQFPMLIVTNINSSIDSVLLPTMSIAQDNKTAIRAMTRRAIKTSSYIMCPLMVGLAVCADSLVDLILTAKWLPCVPFLRIFCFTFAFYPIHTANLNAIKALGRSDIFLKLEIIKIIVGMIAVVSTMWFGVMTMAYSLLVTTFISQLINSWPNRKLLNYTYMDQIKDIIPSIILAGCMGIAVYCVQVIGLNDILTLLIQVPLGGILYILGSKIFHFESFEYILSTVKGVRHKNKNEKSINNL